MVSILDIIQGLIRIFRENLISQIDSRVIFIFLVLNSIFLIVSFFSYIKTFSVFLSRKRIITLDLYQYNVESYSSLRKTLAFFGFILKSIVLEPLIIFVWFYFYASFIFFIPIISGTQVVLSITLFLVISVRFLAFINEDYALKYTRITAGILALVSLVSLFMPGFMEVFIDRLVQLYNLLGLAIFYIAIVFILEICLRLVFHLLGRDD